MHDDDTWRRLARHAAYSNDWIDVYHDTVIGPDGKRGVYGVVHARLEAVSVLAFRDDEVLLVGQQRYPLAAYSWEIPGGGAAPGEDPVDAAHRELAEETGFRAATLEPFASFSIWNAVSDAFCNVYLAKDLTPGPPAPEATERLEMRWLELGRCLDMIRSGEIHDAITQIAILRLSQETS